MLMDHHVQALDGDEGMLQQQLVGERGRRIKAAAELGLARSSRGRPWGRALGRGALAPLKLKDHPLPDPEQGPKTKATSLESRREEPVQQQDDEEEEEVVEEKMALLRQLVPGGEDMAVEGLLEETADYIAALKAQVGVMRALACMLSGAEGRRARHAAREAPVRTSRPLHFDLA